MAVEEARQAAQAAESRKAEVAVLKAKLKEAGEAIEKKDLFRQKMEETLTAKIKNLEDDIKKKDQSLATRDNEINDYKSKVDANIKQIGELELTNTRTKEEAASQAKRADDLAESSQERITALGFQLNESEELARQKSSTIKKLEQELAVKVQEFEHVMNDKQELLTRRDAEITDLKSQLKRLTKGIGEMSSFFKQAVPFADLEGQGVSKPTQNELLNEEESAAVQADIARVTPVLPDAVPQMVSPDIFQRIITELSEATNIIGQLASLIVHQQAKALGESVEKFPRARLPELLERLTQEISDENLQINFRQRIADSAQITLN
jgi:chromosome segregation ATPase